MNPFINCLWKDSKITTGLSVTSSEGLVVVGSSVVDDSNSVVVSSVET